MNNYPILILLLIQSLNASPPAITARITKTTSFLFNKHVRFLGELSTSHVQVMFEAESSWYICADYYGELEQERMMIRPQLIINGKEIGSTEKFRSTCKDSLDADFRRYIQYLDLGGICPDNTPIFSGNEIELVDRTFVWKIRLTCRNDPSFAIVKVGDQDQLVLPYGKSLVKESYDNCEGSQNDLLRKNTADAVESTSPPKREPLKRQLNSELVQNSSKQIVL